MNHKVYEICLQRLNHAYLYRGIGAICVQRFDDSLNPAIHTTYRISLRSSSYSEPRDPSLSDVVCLKLRKLHSFQNQFVLLKKCCTPSLPESDSVLHHLKRKSNLIVKDSISGQSTINSISSRHVCEILSMILPQVHLRKPCYDFSFL